MADIEYAPWSVVRIIGQGSFGTVYEIKRVEFGETYRAALKVISIPQDEDELRANRAIGMNEKSMAAYYKSCVEELTHEFAILAKMKGHTNIVGYEDHKVVPHANGIGWDIYIRMELLTSLTTYLVSRDLNRNQVVRLGIDLCEALSLCERKHIIHRDIKPDNIFISDEGDFKLGDFGIARTASKTLSNMSRKGTPNYMAPEIYRNEPYNHTADIYSLGIVLYQLMNGKRLPFMPETMTLSDYENALGRRISGDRIPAPADCDFTFAKIILKACAYRPEDRYQSADDMLDDLKKLLNGEKADPLDMTGFLEEPEATDDRSGEETMISSKKAEGRSGEETMVSSKGSEPWPTCLDAEATFLGDVSEHGDTKKGKTAKEDHPIGFGDRNSQNGGSRGGERKDNRTGHPSAGVNNAGGRKADQVNGRQHIDIDDGKGKGRKPEKNHQLRPAVTVVAAVACAAILAVGFIRGFGSGKAVAGSTTVATSSAADSNTGTSAKQATAYTSDGKLTAHTSGNKAAESASNGTTAGTASDGKVTGAVSAGKSTERTSTGKSSSSAQSVIEPSTGRPSYLDTYETPSSMSGDPDATDITIEGKMYRLPCPVDQFTDDGWSIYSKNATDIASQGTASLTLEKNSEFLNLAVTNFDSVEQPAENCAVTDLIIANFCGSETNISFETGTGMKEDTDPEEAKQLLPEYESSGLEFWKTFESDTQGTVSIRYSYNSDGNSGVWSVHMTAHQWPYS